MCVCEAFMHSEDKRQQMHQSFKRPQDMKSMNSLLNASIYIRIVSIHIFIYTFFHSYTYVDIDIDGWMQSTLYQPT